MHRCRDGFTNSAIDSGRSNTELAFVPFPIVVSGLNPKLNKNLKKNKKLNKIYLGDGSDELVICGDLVLLAIEALALLFELYGSNPLIFKL